jgi:hypothetical protein
MDNQNMSMAVQYQDQVAGSSYRIPAPVGVTVKTTVERGNVYLQPTLYNVQITIQEVVRGTAARAKLQAQGISDPPAAGCEYVLARTVFEYSARGKGSHPADYTLMKGEFGAISKDGQEYDLPSIARTMQPALFGHSFSPGSAFEGWLVFQVPEEEREPQLVFKREHTEGAYSIWGYVWFQLY